MSGVTRGWPEKRRREQAERCRLARPWDHATGPRTGAGKDAAKQNALLHGLRGEAGRELGALLRAQRAFVESVRAAIKLDRTRPIPDTDTQ